jgi:hypothetical protein
VDFTGIKEQCGIQIRAGSSFTHQVGDAPSDDHEQRQSTTVVAGLAFLSPSCAFVLPSERPRSETLDGCLYGAFPYLSR